MAQVNEKVPRGFTRFYILYLLTERPMTGKEIIEEAKVRSKGDWTPSPGLIYPLLGRLLRDKLIEDVDTGFQITEEGVKVLKQYKKLQYQFDRQFQLINKLGISVYSAGKFLAEETIDRITNYNESLRVRITQKSGEVQEKFDMMYEEFLLRELQRLKTKKSENIIK
jgi:DNA-binding PadR family transcriptional regulator